MKICVLTQPLGANYGGILQAYALQKVLRDMGHEVTTLRFAPGSPDWIPSGFKKHILTFRRFLSKYFKGNKEIVYCNPERQTRFARKEMDRFIGSYLHCKKASAPLSGKGILQYDAYIVGSDQVWRPKYSPNLSDFYLGFLGDTPVRRLAYAASFGVDTWETGRQMTEEIRPLARRFHAISVREKSGVELCQTYLGVKATVMPDPTLLLTPADYLAFCKPNREGPVPYLAAFVLDKGDRERVFVNRISREKGLPVKYIGVLDWVRGTDSVEQWLKDIAEASFVVTDSFHGTVFSILFGREFLSMINTERGASRFTSLLESVGLQDRMIPKNQLEETLPAPAPIDREKIEEALESQREKGLAFLRANL